MIENLLRRLAEIRPSSWHAQDWGPSSASSAAVPAATEKASEAAASKHYWAAYPRRAESQRLPAQASNDSLPAPSTAWQRAVAQYLRRSARRVHAPILPQRFAGFGDVHAAVADTLWAERHPMPHKLIQLLSARGTLIALVNPRNHQVLIRRRVEASELDRLNWHELPAAAAGIEQGAREQFDTVTVDELLWFFAQAVPHAVQTLPESIGHEPLVLRRFPYVPPDGLELRHLSLIYLLNAGPIVFDKLSQQVDEDDCAHLCADIASLYMTGALASTTEPSAQTP